MKTDDTKERKLPKKATDKIPVAKTPKVEEKLTVHIKIYSPFKTYFEEDVFSVSATNATGPFDVLPKHHNFMTLLNPGDIVVQTDRGEGRIRIARGIMHVKKNNVIVFLDV